VRLGYGKLAIQLKDGTRVQMGSVAQAVDDEQQYVVLHVQTDDTKLSIVFHRGDFSRLCANPNSKEQCEVAVHLKETHDGPEPE
jgi:hypothetical protein